MDRLELGKHGWLRTALLEAVAQHASIAESNSMQLSKVLPPGRGRARRYQREMLRESGLLFGSPQLAQKSLGGAEETLFLGVLKTFARMALDIAEVTEAAPGPRAEQLLLLFASLANRLDEAADIHRRIERATKQWPLPEKLWAKVESALEERAVSLAADPYYGLVLHNGSVYADANVFGRIAIAYFSRHTFPREDVERRLQFAATQKALLAQVLTALVCAERPPGFPTRRAILRQIEDLGLPEALADSTRDFARKTFDRPASIKSILKDVRSQDLKRFILEQTLLASLVDGRRSPREIAWTRNLGNQLGFTSEKVTEIEVAVAEFYARNRSVVDVFTLATGAEYMGEEMVDAMSGAARKNYQRLMKEIRKTGELSVLLSRAARGQKLSSADKKLMREQLISVAKAVPALAIFAAPGGLLLLLALAKVLPFDVLPDSFKDEPHDTNQDDDEPSTSH